MWKVIATHYTYTLQKTQNAAHPISDMPVVVESLRITAGQATGEEDSVAVKDIPNDGVVLNLSKQWGC